MEPLKCNLCFNLSHTSHDSYVDHVKHCVTRQFSTTQNITDFQCFLCRKNYSSLLDLVMHTKECAAKMAVTLGYPGPVASIPQSMVENITDNFEFRDKHFLISQIDTKR